VNKEITLEEDPDLMVFEIVKGDYGGLYVGTIEDEDFDGWTGVIYVWSASGVMRVNGETCTVAYVSPDTTISYTVQKGDFSKYSGIHYGLFKLTNTLPDRVERTLKFSWEVFDREVS